MPPRSEAQRRAMFAAAAGHSTLGIPRSVGEEYAAADMGGELPEHMTAREAAHVVAKRRRKRRKKQGVAHAKNA